MMNKLIVFLSIIFLSSSCNIHKTIYVADSYATCEGDTSQKCLQVKEAPEDDWVLLPEGIEGFDYQEGATYKMEVVISKVKNPSVNESSLKYKLVKIIYQDKNKVNQQKTTLSGHWEAIALTGIEKPQVLPTLHFDLDTNNVSGKAGCNTYETSFTIENEHIKFGIPIATKMYCTNMNVEKAFFNCLQNTAYYKFEDGKLTFYSKDGQVQMACNKIEG